MKICEYTRTYSLLCLWVAAVGLIVHTCLPISAQSSIYYASDTLISVLGTLGVMLAELITLYLFLEPWHRSRSAIRPFVTLAIFTPWTFLSTVAAMHASNAVLLHGAWLWGVECLLVLILLIEMAIDRKQ